MQVTVTIDEKVFDSARQFSGLEDASAVINHALRKYVQREAALRLIEAGGSQPDLVVPPRRRWEPE